MDQQLIVPSLDRRAGSRGMPVGMYGTACSRRLLRSKRSVATAQTVFGFELQPCADGYLYPHFDGVLVAHPGDRVGRGVQGGRLGDGPCLLASGVVAEVEVSIWASARLHSRRFYVHRATSLIRLMSVDRRVAHPDGGVAIVTFAGHRLWWTLLFVAPYVSGLGALVAAPNLGGKAIGLLISCLAGFLLGPRFARQLHAGASFDVRDQPWMLTDVATVTGLHIGDRMLEVITSLADVNPARLVLSVRPDNASAVHLYQRHGFLSIGSRKSLLLMQRVPLCTKSAVTTPPPSDGWSIDASDPVPATDVAHSRLTAALCATTIGALVLAYRSEPQVWLMPGVAVVAVYAAAIDLATRRVPNVLTASGAMVSIAVLAVLSGRNDVSFRRALLGMIVMATPLLVSHLVTRSRTPGLGDVKLAGVLGLAVGAVHPVLAYFALTSALVLGAVLGGLHRWLTGQRTFPFAPAVSIGVVGVLLLAGAVGVDRQWLL